MLFKRQFLIACVLSFSSLYCTAQIEVARLSTKGFEAIGFGAFLSFSIPVADADYIVVEGGVQDFRDKNTNEIILAPVLGGYRYTLDRSGEGFYVEPNAGYVFGGTDVNDNVGGIAAGVSVGYLVDLGNIPFNFSLRYERSFGAPNLNIVSLRIAHSFSFRKRERE